MKAIEAVAATTHVDAHNECLSREGVESLVRQYDRVIIPLWIQHDPRIPPVGRFLRGEVRQLPDGELAAVAYGETWEPGEAVPFLSDRKMPLGRPDHDRLFLRLDRGFSEHIDSAEFAEFEELLGSEPQPEVKKALDPLTVLTLGGTFLAGSIANGFVSALTADAYRRLKLRVKTAFRKRREAAASQPEPHESLFVFKAFVKDDAGFCVVDVIITDPTDDDLEFFFDHGLHRLDEELSKALRDRQQIERIVIGIQGRDFRIKFGVRSDAAPVGVKYY